MLDFKSKKIMMPLYLGMLSVLLSPALTQAEPYGTGDIASKRATEQREAIAKRAERKKQEAAAKKQPEVKKEADTQKEPEAQTEKPDAQ